MVFADRFVLGERVGLGATGEVLRAFDKERNVYVAVKRLHEHLVADPYSRERFDCEVRLSSRIAGDHVVRCLGGGVDENDSPYLVLEWLDGVDLAQRMKTSTTSTKDAIEIARQAALGLQALHDAGIVHRDVKPGNFFVTNGGSDKPFVVKLLDLGLAHDRAAHGPDGSALGTPFYMSPEQAQGGADIGPPSDLFSLGALLFELLSGQRPFVGETTFMLLAKIALQASPRLSDVVPNAPAVLDAFLARAIARDPSARFASAREMAEQLEIIAQTSQDLPTTVPLPSMEPSAEHLVGVVFGRLPLSSHVGRHREIFQDVVGRHQGRAVSLLGRGVAGVFEGECADGLLRAADATLDLAKHIAGVRLSLATGSALPPDVGLSGPVIERGARALERARVDGTEACVRIDDETASLLEDQYVVEGFAGALSLRAAR